MGHKEARRLLQQTQDEDKAADKKLSVLAESGINQNAADAAHSEEEDEEMTGGVGAGKGSRPAGRGADRPAAESGASWC